MDITETAPIKTKKRKKKQPWQIVIKDRFLTNEKPENPYLVALLYFFVFFMSFLLVFVCFFQLCDVRQESMMNTLNNGDCVLLLKEASSFKRGDIVVIQKEEEKHTKNIIKRIIGVSGDTLKFVIDSEKNDGTVILFLKQSGSETFEIVDEPYIKEPMKKDKGFPSDFNFNEEIVVPEEHIFVMGDNRAVSEDSRGEDGAYPVASICGKSIMKIKKGSILEILLRFLYPDRDKTFLH